MSVIMAVHCPNKGDNYLLMDCRQIKEGVDQVSFTVQYVSARYESEWPRESLVYTDTRGHEVYDRY